MERTENQRVAETEALFREVNERIAESAARFQSDELDIVCECADAECVERLPTTVDEYERVRANGARFLVAPGHEDESFEQVVGRRVRYRVVEKVRPWVASLVRRLDPRQA
jgi:hypothetical protein